MNGVSRHFEWQADHFAADLPHQLGAKYIVEKDLPTMGDRLGKALVTLHVKNLSTVWVDWLFVLSLTSEIWRMLTFSCTDFRRIIIRILL